MVCLRKAQRNALFRLFQRDFPSLTPFRQSITRENRVTHARRISLSDSGSLAPIAVPTGPSHETKCPRSFPYLALVMLFDAGPSTTSNRQTATIIWAAPPAPNWGLAS